MRILFKKLKFILFPLLSLGVVSIFSMISLGVVKNPLKKDSRGQQPVLNSSDLNVLKKIDDIKRHVAAVNQQIETTVADENQQSATQKEASTIPANGPLGEMHIVSGSTVKTLMEEKCYFENIQRTVSSSQIKFDFLECAQSDRHMKLINRTNGYQAEIFPSRGKKVSSDFIQLQQGENELIFEISSTPGQIKSQIIKINRIK